MKESEIKFKVELDDQNVPDKIYWEATDNPNEGLEQTRAISIAVWDHFHTGTLKIDLWTKDMEVGDMKRFYIEIMSGIANTVEGATGDKHMSDEIHALCKVLSRKLEEELRNQK